MQRSSIIATVVAAGGVLIAGSVASVAVINAASSSQPSSETVAMVSTNTPAIETVVDPAPVSTPEATPLPSLEASALPALPTVNDQPTAKAKTTKVKVSAAKPATKPAAKPASTPKPKPTHSAATNTVSAGQARSSVLKQGDGVSVLATSRTSHAGYDTWAVKISRSNGEIITGYVDRESGVVVDWAVNQAAPAAPAQPAATPTHSSDDDGNDDHGGSDHEGSDDHGGDDD